VLLLQALFMMASVLTTTSAIALRMMNNGVFIAPSSGLEAPHLGAAYRRANERDMNGIQNLLRHSIS
jgi:hypothetical protein